MFHLFDIHLFSDPVNVSVTLFRQLTWLLSNHKYLHFEMN